MSKEIYKKQLLELLNDRIKSYHFILNKQLGEFTKKKKDGWDKFQLIFLNRNDTWEINIGMLIRKDFIEKIYHEASSFDPKYHRTTPTIGITIEKFINDGNEYRCYLSSENDVYRCVDYIERLFNDIALSFFEKYDNLSEMDRAVNVKNGDGIFSGLKYEGSLGIILAKLVINPEYDFFLHKYYAHYQKLNDGFYLPEYEKLVKILDDVVLATDLTNL
ncbi:MAG TPA: hypothetical protein VK671_07955 [Mucilaginibacter sp.]|jgi:hypothetical protein|nr:hypothetical protein [Mucilaginibacter sp.]